MKKARDPFYVSIYIVIFLPILLFVVNEIMIIAVGIRSLNENNLDKLLHILGGTVVALSASGGLWRLARWKILAIHDKNVFSLLVFGCVCFVVIGWEIFEYVIYHPFEFLTYGDTIADMVCGLFGGAFAVCTLRFMSFNKIVY